MSELITPTGEAAPRPWFPGGERAATFLVVIAVLYAAYLTIRPYLMVLLLAAAVASLTYRWSRLAVRLVRGRVRLGAALTTFTLLVGVGGPLIVGFVLAARRIIAEVLLLAQHLRQDGTAITRFTERLGPLGRPTRRLVEEVGPRITEGLPQLAQRAAALAGQVGTALAHIGIALLIFTVAVYYFYVNGPKWRERFIRLLPLPPDGVRLFLRRFQQVSAAVLIGNFGTALAQGICATIGYAIFGAPLPLLWGAATMVSSLIPLFGSMLVWLPLSLFVGLTAGWGRGLGLLTYSALIVATIDNVVRPLLSRFGLELHPLLIFLAIFGGLGSFGVAGLFLGPLILVLTITALDLHEQGWRPVPQPAA